VRSTRCGVTSTSALFTGALDSRHRLLHADVDRASDHDGRASVAVDGRGDAEPHPRPQRRRTEPQARLRPGGLRPAALERFAETKRDRGAPTESYADGSAEPSGSGDGGSPWR